MDRSQHKTVFLNNLQVLGFDARDHATGLYEHVVFDQDMFSHANNVKAFIVTSHFLFTKLDPRRTRNAFRTCWPIVEFRRQSREYVAAAFRWLEELRRDNCLMPSDLVLRKSLFEDCKGEKIETIMMALSTYVLQSEVENLYGKISSSSAMPPIRLLGKDAHRPTSKYALKKELEESMRRTSMVLKHTAPELPSKQWTPIARSLILDHSKASASPSIAQEKHERTLRGPLDTVMEQPSDSRDAIEDPSLVQKSSSELLRPSTANQPTLATIAPPSSSLLPKDQNTRNISKPHIKEPIMKPSFNTQTRNIKPSSEPQQTNPAIQISTRSSLPSSFTSRYSEKGKGIERKSAKLQDPNEKATTRSIRTSAIRKSIGHAPYSRPPRTKTSERLSLAIKAPGLPESPEVENFYEQQTTSPGAIVDIFKPLRSFEPVDTLLASEYDYSPLFRSPLSTPEEIAQVKQQVDAIQERLSHQKRASLPVEQQEKHLGGDVMHIKNDGIEEQLPASPEQARRYVSSPDRSAPFTPLSARVSPMDDRYPGYSDLIVNQVIENFDDEKTPTSRHRSSAEQTPQHRANEDDDVVVQADGMGSDIQRLSPPPAAAAATAANAELNPSVEMVLDPQAAIGKWFEDRAMEEATLSFVKHFSTPETLQRTLHPNFDQYEDVYRHSDQHLFARPIAHGYMHSPSRRYMPVAKEKE